MKLFSWNVNGLRACMNKGFTDFLAEYAPDIICLQETKMQREQADFVFPGYEEFWNSAEKKGYSGTAIFTKQNPLNVTYGLGIAEHDKEGRVITAEFADFYLVTVYTPNSQRGLARLDYRMQWEVVFREYLERLDAQKPVIVCGDLNSEPTSSTSRAKEKQTAIQSHLQALQKRKPVIICGDLNVAASEIDLKNPKSNRNNAGFTDQEREKFQELLQVGFIDTFRYLHPDEIKYSWWSYMFKAREKNAGWRIDYFLASECLKNNIISADIHTNVMGSDHCPISLEIDI